MVIWGVPFVVIGQYMIWGRFLFDAWLKRRTYYAVTNRRILVLQEGWKRKAISVNLGAIPSMEREGTGVGTMWFGPKLPLMAGRGQRVRNSSRFWIDDVPVFADVDDVDAVHRLVLELTEAAKKEHRATTLAPGPLTYPMKD